MTWVKAHWLIVIAVIILAIAGSILSVRLYRARITSAEFFGNFGSLKDHSIFADGKFQTSRQTYLPAGNQPFRAEIIVTPTTKFHRTAFYMPTAKELAKTGGRFNPDELKKDESDVDFAAFAKDASGSAWGIGLDVAANGNILNSVKFEASSITYRLPINSKL